VKVTRIAYSKNLNQDKLDRLTEIASRLGTLRTELWDRFGSIAGVGVEQREMRDQWLADKRKFDVPARLWKETLRDTMADIVMYREAAKVKVRRAIPAHTKDKSEQKRLYTLLKADRWLEDGFLRRMMRKYFKHGHTSVDNQIILDTGCYTAFEFGGRAWVDVMSLERGQRIAIPLNTTVKPNGTLRLILRDGKVEVHYAIDLEIKSDCGDGVIGIDKGYTEAFTDSDGQKHGIGLGDRLSSESDFLKEKYKNRNKLKEIAKKKPHVAKANLGRKKLERRKKRHTSNVRDIVFKAAHSVVDKAKVIVCEDLTSPIPDKKKYGKNQSRRLSGWVKGTMAEAMETVSQRRGSSLSPVNAAYTSQMDSRSGTLLGQRTGDTFHCFDGVVQDADTNAARNILARQDDTEIALFTPYKQVKAILLQRTAEVQKRLGLLNQDTSCNGYQLAMPLSTVSEEPNFYQ
jgi:IS605 OrfB family transposase